MKQMLCLKSIVLVHSEQNLICIEILTLDGLGYINNLFSYCQYFIRLDNLFWFTVITKILVNNI